MKFSAITFLLLLAVGVSHQKHGLKLPSAMKILPDSLNVNIAENTYLRFDRLNDGLKIQVIEGDVTLHDALLYKKLRWSLIYYEIYEHGVRIVSDNEDIDFRAKASPEQHGFTIDLMWKSSRISRKQICFNLGNAQWNGGPQQKRQFWPIQKLVLPEYSYVPKEADNAAITEPYWLNSEGSFIYVHKEVPLFIDQNSFMNNTVCFISDIKPPYSLQRHSNDLKFVLGFFENSREAHKHVIENYFKKPTGYPDYRMTELPIWSTWAEYKRDINESIVLDFANKIIQNNFKNGQLEIDDLWETCYGSLIINENSFPNMKGLIENVKKMGFRVTFWIHPFINKDCQPYYNEALQKGYLVQSENHSFDTSWWNSVGPTSSYIDFTNPEAANWWYLRLRTLQDNYGIDSFKFDAGETSWSPQIPVQNGDVNEQPGFITIDYVKTCARFGSMIEVRSGLRTQELPIYVRMIDKDSEWNFENGLPTLITTLLQMNMNGYVFVLPDMIGGNGYNGKPGKELFIRWLEANTFMPSLQFSYVPWGYDAETVNISRKFADLHEKYTYKVIEAFQRAVETGAPVNPPIWWIDPIDEVSHTIWDEYLLGEDILVAPVIVEGARSRDIYLPQGRWLAQGEGNQTFEGRQWIKGYPAPLDSLPFFVKV